MKFSFQLLFVVFFYGASSSFCQNSSDLVFLEEGSLTYKSFAMSGQSNEVNKIPDFSFAGYQKGGVPLPTSIPIRATVNPEEGDDAGRIQAAINFVEDLEPDENGFRGVVLITAGHYSLENLLLIRESGVVLRGEGQGLNGTVLHSNPRNDIDVISIVGYGDIVKDSETTQQITTAYVPVGSYSFDIEDASGYAVGDQIVVTRTPNQVWIDTLEMDQVPLCDGKPDCFGWTPSSYTIDHERVITAITENTITIDLPIVDVMEETFGGGSITKILSTRRSNQCGIENMRIQSFYDANSDENHAWTAIRLRDVEHCWVKQVTGQYLAYSTVNIESGNFITVQDCAYIDPKSQVTGARRYAFAIQEGLGNFFQRCYAVQGRHDFVTGSRVTGPNVFLDGLAESANSDIGPHHRWATGTLFDNISGGSMRVWNRGNSGSGHGWSGAQTMFWNLNSYGGEFRVDSPLGSMNWGIGCIGTQQTGEGYWESWGDNLLPRSLYLQQLSDRLGEEAVNNITISEQQSSDIYDYLAQWAGNGEFSDGGYVGEIPEVTITQPENPIDVSTWAGGDIHVEATDSDGTVVNVKLLINGEPLGIKSTAPYIFTDVTSIIRNLSHEVHYLQAIATDNDGNTNVTRLAIMGGDPPVTNVDEEEEQEQDRNEIRVFPIPTYDQTLTIEMVNDGAYNLTIFDIQGRLIDQKSFEGLDYQFRLEDITQGTYFMKIQSGDDTVYRSKFVVM